MAVKAGKLVQIPQSSAPSHATGLIYHGTDNKLYISTGSAWIVLAG
tara:strand:- start:2215 stop:2352 length:138 start_codon:yes stop_codon:yes gene_type:complete